MITGFLITSLLDREIEVSTVLYPRNSPQPITFDVRWRTDRIPALLKIELALDEFRIDAERIGVEHVRRNEFNRIAEIPRHGERKFI